MKSTYINVKKVFKLIVKLKNTSCFLQLSHHLFDSNVLKFRQDVNLLHSRQRAISFFEPVVFRISTEHCIMYAKTVGYKQLDEVGCPQRHATSVSHGDIVARHMIRTPPTMTAGTSLEYVFLACSLRSSTYSIMYVVHIYVAEVSVPFGEIFRRTVRLADVEYFYSSLDIE